MTPRLMLLPLAFALVATVTFASGESDQPAAATEKEMVLDPSTGEMVTAPEYGGTIRVIANFKNEGIDPYYRYTSGVWLSLTNEKLGGVDWAFDRSVVGFDTQYLPAMVVTGMLAESWENPDPLTYIFKIRDGVFWHDKAPVNGRQLTAHDVKFNYERIVGLSGERGVESAGVMYDELSVASITAPDDFTLVVKLNEPDLRAQLALLWDFSAWIVPPEVIEQFGDMQDWRNVAGTGPYEWTDFVEGSSATYTKHDDYWRNDPKFPDNRLPYADKVEFLFVNDPAAITSLMRSGQADWMGFALNSHLTSVDAAVSLQKSNPNLVLQPFAYRSETAIGFNVQKEPFSDIRVRQALSLAIDHEAIAESYMQGWGDASPQGPTGAKVLGYAVPFEEWPEEFQQYFRYDPEEAERLLDEAGYPRDADGIRFSTVYQHYEFFDLGYYQIAMDYLRQIGIDVEIQEITRAEHTDFSVNYTYLGLRTETWAEEYASGLAPLSGYWSKNSWNPNNVNDPVYDEYYENAQAATTVEEQQEWARKANLLIVEQLWKIRGPIAPLFGAIQPWLKGYNGEGELGPMNRADVFQYLWVDQDLKRELGS